ncbi:MAG TPA: hypothetical protein VM802_23350 [Chitinophaga sp.]|uniref:hypothetical protein n=1 Tax=Chitinophaga sp. TaxID=1869181 RepID=UPI002CC8C9DA|nr:hypothetical protein [Chitinophaga sp.]HVI47825.1 hypothetical protein [Chitinophaga sp.]
MSNPKGPGSIESINKDLATLSSSLNTFNADLQRYLASVDNTPGTKAAPVLIATGTFKVGDVPGSDGYYRVTLPQLVFVPYMIAGSLRSTGSDWNKDNDVIWMVRDLLTDSFVLLTREVSGNVQDLYFDYVLIQK